MNNLKYFPFERNQYYYGKLLTEQDFTAEQRYMNDKRRLHARFLHGVGVAAGLKVVAVDEKSVSVEDGVAVDFSGREIVVDAPAVKRLSTIDGFEAVMERGAGDLAYLCIEYQERDEAPAHSIAAGGSSQPEFDRKREGYRLYLTDREPESRAALLSELVRREEILYEDRFITVRQTFPRSVNPGEQFETVISVENRGNAVTLDISIKEELEGAVWEGEKELAAVFRELFLNRGERKEQSFYLRSFHLKQGSVSVTLRPEQMTVRAGRDELHPAAKKRMNVEFTGLNAMEAMERRYFDGAMENAVRENYPQGIYLAKITLIRTEGTYMIESVVPMPFGQYVYSTQLLAGMIKELFRERRALAAGEAGGAFPYGKAAKEDGSAAALEPLAGEGAGRILTSQGTVQISLGVGGKRGQRFFSPEIFHGLGLGPVQIELAIQEDDVFYSGSPEIFEEMEVKAELAARLNASKGAFVVGVRLTEPTGRQSVAVRWRAQAFPMPEELGTEKHMYIVPGKLELRVRETYYLEAVCENVPGATVLWSVAEPFGGTVDSDGAYTAPNVPGVYEVTAQCQEAPGLKASLFVVVRE